jgi:predicted MPP superfamily phosphohydrolase
LLLLLLGLGLYAFWLEPSSLRITRYQIAAPVPALRGLKVAVIADLHAGSNYIGKDKIDRVVAMTNAAHPDLILLAGDYVSGVDHVWGGPHVSVKSIALHLKPLKAPLGVHAVLGNHDNWTNPAAITAALNAVGIDVLTNARRVLVTRRGPLVLAGIGDWASDRADPAKALDGLAPDTGALCLTHSPDVFPHLPGTCAFTIAAHTHGGQVRLPLLGRPVTGSRHGQRYVAGLVQERGRTMFVSTGIGTSLMPVRFGVPPEISLLMFQ